MVGWRCTARAAERSRAGALIDGAAIYAATVYPLIWWHAHLPRSFAWMLPGDFVSGLPPKVAFAAGVLYVASLGAYVARALLQVSRGALIPWGKHLLLGATAVTWYVGIVATDDDVAFTLGNVLSHGVPYAALVFCFARFSAPREPGLASRWLAGKPGAAALRFVACLWLLAYAEELLWDRSLWHERPELFGVGAGLGGLEPWLVPLLALPQLSHYVLDGLFWRRAQNPSLRAWLAPPGAAPEPASVAAVAPHLG